MNHTRNRLPAEWEDYEAVIIGWPHVDTDWAYILEDVQHTVIDIIESLVEDRIKVVVIAPDINEPISRLADLDSRYLLYCNVPTNDTWARDYGVITCLDGDKQPVLMNFKFNGWGLKFAADKDNLITSNLVKNGVLTGRVENHLGFVLEGGSIESDGLGSILTTSQCLLSPNRNGQLSKNEIECYLNNALGSDRILWLDHGYLAGDDTDSHIDTLARLVSPDTIVYVKCDDPDDEHFTQLSLMEKELRSLRQSSGLCYNLIALPLPSPVYDQEGKRLPATYANFLITPHSILLPSYRQPHKDQLAQLIMQSIFPDRKVKTVDCTALIQQHGSLHCMTMQVPFGVLSKININGTA